MLYMSETNGVLRFNFVQRSSCCDYFSDKTGL